MSQKKENREFKIVNYKELATVFKLHYQTIAKYAKLQGVDLYNVYSVISFIQYLTYEGKLHNR